MPSNINSISKMAKIAVASSGIVGSGLTAVTKDKSNYSSDDDYLGSYGPVGAIITIVALYLAFKCKDASGGINFGEVFFALFCSICYIPYRLAVPCK